jgi:hypothetical protein
VELKFDERKMKIVKDVVIFVLIGYSFVISTIMLMPEDDGTEIQKYDDITSNPFTGSWGAKFYTNVSYLDMIWLNFTIETLSNSFSFEWCVNWEKIVYLGLTRWPSINPSRLQYMLGGNNQPSMGGGDIKNETLVRCSVFFETPTSFKFSIGNSTCRFTRPEYNEENIRVDFHYGFVISVRDIVVLKRSR